ncbi:MAG: class B sortase [Lachnospiraceae bacterium]|nr:class B sortase [Lachnospiraceae bacterium]
MGYQTWDKVESRRKIRRIVLIVLVVLLLAGAGAGGYLYYRNHKQDQQQQNYEKLKEKVFVTNTPTPTPEATVTPTPTHTPTAEEMLFEALYERYPDNFTIRPDFSLLHEENSDIFAYISIPGTIVDYPILAHEKEDYYLDHNLDHSTGYPGCLYIQNCNSTDLNDKFTIVYGHNMKNGTMFGSLKDYNNAEFRETHPYFFVYQEGRVSVYEIVVISHISTEHLLSADYKKVDGEWVFDKFDTYETSRMLQWVRSEKDKNAYISSPEPTDYDTIMVLSTCGEGKRFIVVGKRVLNIESAK